MALPTYVLEPLQFLEDCEGGPYYVWKEADGHFAGGPPAWAFPGKPPAASRVRDEGSFCAGMLNLAVRVNGVGDNFFTDNRYWAGGVPWWQTRLQNRGMLKTSNRLDYDPGTLFIRFYTGSALADQGHVAIMGRHGNLLQADFFPDKLNGINEKRTLLETNNLLKYWDGGGFQYYVDPADWLKV